MHGITDGLYELRLNRVLSVNSMTERNATRKSQASVWI